MTDLNVVNNQNLDRIRLDDFEVTRPSGAKFKPHAGQSIWVIGYGLTAEDKADVATRMDNEPDGNKRLDILCEFIASEAPRWDVKDFRTGQDLPQPDSAEAVKKLSDELLGFLSKRILGIETEGEG